MNECLTTVLRKKKKEPHTLVVDVDVSNETVLDVYFNNKKTSFCSVPLNQMFRLE